MGKHHRRDGYWKSYHLAHTRELDAIAGGIVSLVKESKPPVQYKKTRRGRKPVHSREKLVCICLLMIVMGYTFRDMQNYVPKLNLPWDEPYPDHSTIHRAYQEMPQEYLDALLERTAQLCMEESGWSKGLLASDSSGVETDRYEEVVRPNKKERRFEKVKRLFYLKYHIIAILDHLIILRARVTSYRVNDSPVLRSMLRRFPSLPGSIFNADRGFDAEANFKRVYELLMHPNIKQIARQKGPERKGPQEAPLSEQSGEGVRPVTLSVEGDDRGDIRSRGVRRAQPQDEVQEGRESREVGRHPGDGMEPQGPEQAQMQEDAADGGGINHTGELGDNLFQ